MDENLKDVSEWYYERLQDRRYIAFMIETLEILIKDINEAVRNFDKATQTERTVDVVISGVHHVSTRPLTVEEIYETLRRHGLILSLNALLLSMGQVSYILVLLEDKDIESDLCDGDTKTIGSDISLLSLWNNDDRDLQSKLYYVEIWCKRVLDNVNLLGVTDERFKPVVDSLQTAKEIFASISNVAIKGTNS